jgi:uncharacterized protein (TIGR00297 family)
VHSNYHREVETQKLAWQSRVVLLAVIAPITISLIWQTSFWSIHAPRVAAWGLGLSALLGLAAWKARSATAPAAATGALITAALMFSTFTSPYRAWNTALIPILGVLILTSIATRFGRRRKERLGTAEKRHGRGAAQVCANLGFAALICAPAVQSRLGAVAVFAAYACLAEALADTVSSEIGQVLGGQPFLLTTLRRVPAGTDGGISVAGTLAGTLASGVIGLLAAIVLHGRWTTACVISVAGIFGLLFDSLLGATLERKEWLNNDAVNFLSTASAAVFELVLLRSFWRVIPL